MHIESVGIDLGKSTFHLVALGERNKILVRKKFSRTQLLAYSANLPASLVGLDACAGAHFVGTALQEQGHQVRLIPAQFVKPYRKSNKNDFLSHPGSGKGRKREPEQKMKIRPKDFALRYLSGETFQKPTRGPE